jgi:hypothetical protein
MGSVDGAPGRALERVTGDLEQAAGRAERLELGSLDALRRRSVEAGRAAAGRQAWGKGSATSARGGERGAQEGPRKADPLRLRQQVRGTFGLGPPSRKGLQFQAHGITTVSTFVKL